MEKRRTVRAVRLRFAPSASRLHYTRHAKWVEATALVVFHRECSRAQEIGNYSNVFAKIHLPFECTLSQEHDFFCLH